MTSLLYSLLFIIFQIEKISFRGLEKLLDKGGIIYCSDPSHYLMRRAHLSMKVFKYGYLKASNIKRGFNIPTHHFCIRKNKEIMHAVPSLKVKDVKYTFYLEN